MTHVTPPHGDDVLEILREIWEDVLETRIDDIDSDFFEVGGDSIGALRVAALGKRSGLWMPRTAVFRHRSLRSLTAAVQDSSGMTMTANGN